jgi:hypothetical protein
MSDDEMDLVGDKNQHARPTDTMVPGLDPEMTDVQVEEDDMNDMPLSKWHLVRTQTYKVCQRCRTSYQGVTFAGI